jgi:hypothetical protein
MGRSAGHIRGLQDLIHSLGAQSALHQISNCDGTHESRQSGIFTLLFNDIVGKDLSRVREGLWEGSQSVFYKMYDVDIFFDVAYHDE